jgi:hypothetical protein
VDVVTALEQSAGRSSAALAVSRPLVWMLLTTERVADAALEGGLPGRNLRKIELADDYQPRLEIVTGIFAVKANGNATPTTIR